MDLDRLARALDTAATQVRSHPSPDTTLAGVVQHVAAAFPSFDHVGLSTTRRGGPSVTHAASTALVDELDALQHELGEGPGVDSVGGAELVVAPRIRHDQRWPRYVPRAVRRGVRSQLAVRLHADEDGAVGALNLYSTTAEEVTPDDLVLAATLAAHAGAALGQADRLDHLTQAIASRQEIGVAVGLIMERYGLDVERAKAFLWRASSTSNVKVREVAGSLVRDANDKNADLPREDVPGGAGRADGRDRGRGLRGERTGDPMRR